MNRVLPGRTTVAIVGAGVAGAAAGYYLSRNGLTDVVLLEQEGTPGYHGSGRTAGLCRQVVEDELVSRLTVAGAAFIHSPPAGFSSGALFRPTGSLVIGTQPRLMALSHCAASFNVAHRPVSLDQVLRSWPRLAGGPAEGAVHFPGDGVIDTHALLNGYLAGVRDAGGQVCLGVHVQQFVDTDGNGVRVVTNRGELRADVVVNAAGAWAGPVGELAGSPDSLFFPLLRHVHRTERIPGLDEDVPFVCYLGGEEFFARVDGEAYLLSACDSVESAPCDARSDPASAAALQQTLKPLAPWLSDFRIERSWAGLRTFAPDGRPVIGWDREVPWLFWVAGLGDIGVTGSAAIGSAAASALLARLYPAGQAG